MVVFHELPESDSEDERTALGGHPTESDTEDEELLDAGPLILLAAEAFTRHNATAFAQLEAIANQL